MIFKDSGIIKDIQTQIQTKNQKSTFRPIVPKSLSKKFHTKGRFLVYRIYDLIVLSIALPVMALICVVSWLTLRKKRLILFRIIAVFILVIEVYKQVGYLIYGYDFWALPFHVCSLFLVSLPLAVFLKQGSRASNFFYSVSLMLGLVVTLAVLIAPSMILFESWWLFSLAHYAYSPFRTSIAYHSVIFHFAVSLFFLLACIFKPYKPKFLDFVFGLVLYIVFLVIAAILATALNVNFAALLWIDFDFMNQLRENTSLFVYQFTMILLYTSLTFLAGLVIYFVSKFFSRKKSKTVILKEQS